MQGEKILNTDVRKIGVIIKKAYSTSELLTNIKGFYRVYVKEGETQVQVQDWTELNRTPNEYYFNFDTRDKIHATPLAKLSDEDILSMIEPDGYITREIIR
jgi:hypothetical protein